MKPTLSMLLLTLAINACPSNSYAQQVKSKIPCIGAIGKAKTTLFKRTFQKIGEPTLTGPIAVSIKSIPFTKTYFKAYKEYREANGKQVSTVYVDSLEQKPRYFELQITDIIGLKMQLNASANNGLISYLVNDSDNKLLTGVSFVANAQESGQLEKADHIFLVENHGMLTLEAQNPNRNTKIDMTSLEVFDFETSSFCWKNNTYGKPEIAVIALKGASCPTSTEKNPEKLNDTKAYLKF